MNERIMKLPLQYFAQAGEMGTGAEGAGQSDTTFQETAPPAQDYEALVGKDASLKTWLDSKVQQAVQTAVTDAKGKWEKLQGDKLTEAEKLQAMTAEEKAEYYRKKAEDLTAAQSKAENARSMEKQAGELFKGAGIPGEFLSTVDFGNVTAESIKERVELMGQFEYYRKGAFDEAVKNALDEKLKQEPPKTVNPGGFNDMTLSGIRAAAGLKDK